MARRYTRDNRGRFASAGSGATARGGRLKTAGGNKRQTQTMTAKAAVKGTVGKPRGLKPGSIKPKPAPQPTAKRKFEKISQGAGRRTAALADGRRISIHDNGKSGFSAVLVGKDGAPRMQRNGLRNVTAAKAWASNPNARGPRLMGGGLKTEAAPKATWFKASRPAGTQRKPRGLKPDAAMSSRLKMRDKTSALGKIAQRREFQASMRKVASQITPAPSKPRVKAGRPTGVIKGTDKMNTHAFITKAGQNKAARAQSKARLAAQGIGIRKPAANSIRRTGRKAPRNNVKPYRPVTPDGQMGRSERKIDRSMKQLVDSARSIRQTLNARKPQIDKFDRQLQRMNAKAIAGRLKKGIRGDIAGMELRIMGGKSGRKAIQRRMGRAAEAAARGSKPAAKAQQIYANQLAFMGSGKAKAGRNNFRPGPRNTTGTPKRKPKRKK